MDIINILNENANLNNMSQYEYIEAIKELVIRYKWASSQLNNSSYQQSQIDSLNAELIQLSSQVEKLKEINNNYSKVLSKPLSLRERALGKIDLKFRTQK